MNDKLNVWSEYRKGSADDSVLGLNSDGTPNNDAVDVTVVKHGIIVKPDCVNCGRQMQQLHVWPEIVHLFRGAPLPGAVYTMRGPQVSLQCKGCGHLTPELIELDELRRWIDVGIRAGLIPPQVLQAKR